ncbi:hypothetical protein M6D81_04260 [Paenibacillus sp. J5C_2022]|uniref:hypothetical protein n=1 Tax=Paenibacillus sp. J5C2022 TaxID=2977129 RepID=UPI0021D14404|nr:hypothetical protein [Paenibacillus sp. J5C2022]MCU6707918.1 hypothetical protein [Paenibacillus sp. J5C2022]
MKFGEEEEGDTVLLTLLAGDSLENSHTLLRNASLYAIILLLPHWNGDSRSLYLKLPPGEGDGELDRIVKYE